MIDMIGRNRRGVAEVKDPHPRGVHPSQPIRADPHAVQVQRVQNQSCALPGARNNLQCAIQRPGGAMGDGLEPGLQPEGRDLGAEGGETVAYVGGLDRAPLVRDRDDAGSAQHGGGLQHLGGDLRVRAAHQHPGLDLGDAQPGLFQTGCEPSAQRRISDQRRGPMPVAGSHSRRPNTAYPAFAAIRSASNGSSTGAVR